MKKKLTITLVISSFIFVVSVASLFVLVGVRNNTKHKLTVGSQVGGYIEVKINKEKLKVDENSSEEYDAKRKDEITLTAKNLDCFVFDSWYKDGKILNSDAEIVVKIEDDAKYVATFAEITYDLTVKAEGKETVTYEYGSSKNLLQSLREEFATENGYTYEFFIGKDKIESTTVITEAKEITVVKTVVNYTIKYTHNDTVVEERTYNVENLKEVQAQVAPTLPEATKGYTIAWKELKLSAENLANVEIKTFETPIAYTATFVFKGEEVGTDTFTVEDQILTYPAVEEFEQNGYSYAWTEFVFNYENVEIEYVETINEYTITFMHKGEVVETKTYTVLTVGEELYYPALPEADQGYDSIDWVEYVLSAEDLKDIEVVTTQNPIVYTATFVHEGNELGKVEFTVETLETLMENAPVISQENVEDEGKEFRWEEFTFNYEDLTINSIYDCINYTLTFNLDGGAFDVEVAETYTIDTDDIVVPAPTKEGYTFLGWTGTDLTELTEALTIVKGSIGDREYTANWEAYISVVKLGTLTNVAKVYYGTDAENITNELTVEGFVANADEEYFFKAELILPGDYQVVTFVAWSGAVESTDEIASAQTFKPEVANQEFVINAEAKVTDMVVFEFEYNFDFKDDNLGSYTQWHYAEGKLYNFYGSELRLEVTVEQYAGMYYKAIDYVYENEYRVEEISIDDVNINEVSSESDFVEVLKEILAGDSTTIYFYYY